MTASTDRKRLRGLAFYAASILLVYLVYEVIRPFLAPLTWAAVFAICFEPLCRWSKERIGPSSGAALTTIVVALAIVIPLVGVASVFVAQASTLLGEVPRHVSAMPGAVHQWLQGALHRVPGGEAIDPGALLADSVKRVAAFLSDRAAAVLQDTVALLLGVFITLFALFFFLRDGPAVMAAIRGVLPFEPDVREQLITQTAALVTASMRAGLLLATVQGVACGVAFWIVGLAAPLFWGVVAALFCLLPIGAWIVWGPAALGLALTGSIGRGLVLAAFGTVAWIGVDTVLRPMLLRGHSEMNGLALFISLLGGVVAFGMVGLVAGPVLMAAAIALFRTFASDPSSEPDRAPTAGNAPAAVVSNETEAV